MRPYALIAAADTALAAAGQHQLRWATKPLLMPTLMVGKPRRVQRALALGGAGDVALHAGAFTPGLAAFLGSHLAWVAALRPQSQHALSKRKAVPYLAAWAGFNAFLWSRTGKDRVPVLLYSSALLGTGLAALDAGKTTGGLLFMASDGLLALERFGDVQLPMHEGIVMATYTSAQSLLAQPMQVRA